MKNNILGASAAVGETELTGRAVEVGNGGMTTALVGVTGSIGADDGDREARSIEARKEEFTLVARDGEISEAFRKMGVVISNQEAGANFVGTKGTEVAKGRMVAGGADNSTAINLGPA